VLIAGPRRVSSVFVRQLSPGAEPPAAAGQSGSSGSGGASVGLRQRPLWLPRGWQPGCLWPAAEAAPAPAAVSQTAEAAAAFALEKLAGRTQGRLFERASGGAASPRGRDSSNGGNSLSPAAFPPEPAAAVPSPSPFQEAAESGGSFYGGGRGGGEPAPAVEDAAQSRSPPPNPFQLVAGAAFCRSDQEFD